ncbi:hypothetical protein [Lewinella sp. IMCC34183]|uniref:hypothetical protein n=1 Tax=Lewinella sp. IMCC34183 TaxID=2248762 RepID=UPI000E264EAD|nr:hypothetical protein [Lewinella sp. IMCC34183]
MPSNKDKNAEPTPETYDNLAAQPAENNVQTYIKDLLTLDVVTLTGNVDLAVTGANGERLRLGRLYNRIEEMYMAEDSQVRVLAITHVELDKDSVTYIKEGLSTQDEKLLTYHLETVRAASEARAAMAAGVGRLLNLSKPA